MSEHAVVLHTVNGKVVDADGQPFASHLIKAFNKQLRAETQIGYAITDSGGLYTIKYIPNITALRIAAYGGTSIDAPGTELASSPVLFSPGTTETIDIVIDREAYRGPSAYDRLLAQMNPILPASLTVADLKEDETYHDITFLSGKTRQPVEHIASLISANRLKTADLKPEIFYAFFREGLPNQLPDLLRQSPEVQRRALEEAIKKNTIPLSFNDSVDKVLESVVQLIVARAVEPQQQDGQAKTSLGQLLSTTVPDAATQEAFLTEYIKYVSTNPISEFWKEIKLNPNFSAHADNLEFTFQLATLTMNHLPLVQELQKMRSANEITSLSDLARFGQKDWQEIISRQIGNSTSGSPIIGFPPNIPGNDDNEKTANYTRVLARMVEDISPGVFIASNLEKESNDDSIPGKQDLVTFLKANTEFDFKSTHLQSYLAGKPHALDNVSDVEGTKIRIKAIQRLYKVAPHYDQVSVLMKDGLDSANAVARMGQNTFVAKYGDALGGSAAAKSVHDKAIEVQAKATSVLAEYGLASYKVPMSALNDEAQTAVDGFPEWSTLFGSLDLCNCEDCRSVYSPAAYFVDVLHFLKDRPSKIVGSSAKDILFERRPDLGEIELTCENTNTTIPYVDLVNEILENAVSPFPPFPPKPPSPFSDVLDPALEKDLNSRTVSEVLRKAFNYPGYQLSPDALISVGGSGLPWALDEPWWSIDDAAFTYTIRKENSGTNPQLRVVSRSLQTKGSSSERGANPQYINAGAYETLRQSVFPWMSLPFNLWNEEVNIYLGHLGVRRHQIMEIFLPGDRRAILNNPAVACAYLDISRSSIPPPNVDISESSLITGATSSQPGASSPGVWNLWGFSAETLSMQNSIPDPSDSTRRITTGNWLDIITKRVDLFLQQSGLIYSELLELLDTVFINPLTSLTGGSTSSGDSDSIAGSRVIKISSKDPDDQSTCEIAKLQLSALDNNNLNQDTVQKIMQFVRLWRKLDGWTMRDLDRAISALRPSKLDETFIIQLSHIQRLRLRLNLPIINILSFWAPIDTASYYVDHDAPGQPNAPSLYDMVFRNKTVSQTPDPAFTEKPDDRWVNGTLSEHAAAISSSLGISTADFQLLLLSPKVVPRSTAEGTGPDDKLNLNHLSSLYRHSTLAKMMKISIRDYISILDLAGVYNVHLTSLPSSFSFPPEFAGSIRYDSTNKKIIASRFFPESERVLLLSASNDPNYNAAIKALFKLQDAARTQKPFGSTEDTILFIENVDRVKASPLSIEELVYLLLPPPNGTTSSSSSPLITPTEEAIAAVLDEIRAELQRIASENTFNKEPDTDPKSLTADPNNSSLTRQKLSLLNWDSALVDQVIATISDGIKYQMKLDTLPSDIDLKVLNDTVAVDLASLPAGFSFPSAIGNYVRYDSAAKIIVASRILSEQERVLLSSASSDQSYTDAVKTLFTLQEDPGLQGKISYDQNNHKLEFDGIMTKARQSQLKSASADALYGNAIDALFNEPRNFVKRYMRRFSIIDYSTRLDALPASVQFPKNLRNKVYFDASAEPKQLHFIGPMFENERDLLLGLSTEPATDPNHKAYQDAVNDLFSQADPPTEEGISDAFITDVDRSLMFDNPTTIEKRFEVLLNKLLPHLQKSLSENLVKQKIAENLNLEYRVADELLTRYVNSPAHSESKSIAEFVPTPPNFSARSFVENNLNIKLNRTVYPDQFNTFTLLYKIGSFITKFKISVKQLVWIFEYGQSDRGENWLDLNKLPLNAKDPSASFDSWLRLVELVRLRDNLPSGEAILDEIFRIARAQSASPLPPIILERLAQYTRWDLTDLQFLTGAQGFKFPTAAFQDERALAHIWDCFVLINGLKMSAEKCRALAEAQVTQDLARSVRQSVRERYGDQDQWLSVAKPLRDILRDKQRNSLAEYLVAHLKIPLPVLQSPHPTLSWSPSHIFLPRDAVKELQQKLNAAGSEPLLSVNGVFDEATRSAVISFQQFNGIVPNDGVVGPQTWSVLDTVGRSLRDKNDLYSHFLIDVEMNPCMITSRIKQALSSMQLFVQRSLMNLEESVQGSSDIDVRWLDWKWMKNYRVWEANRKIFLYPENWIEPELRDDKSSFFSELESDLLQGDLTDEAAENALMSYLAKLDQVARLEIVGMYHQVERGNDGSTAIDTLHVFGRTLGTPHVYYYRQQVSASQWTSWEKVDLDIEGDDQIQLVPLVWNRRLYLFWPTFMAQTSTDPNAREPPSYNVQIAWSERQQNNKWSAKKQPSTSLVFQNPYQGIDVSLYVDTWLRYKFEPPTFVLRSSIDEYNNLYITVIFPAVASEDGDMKYSIKAFRFNGCNNDPVEPYPDTVSWQLETLTGTYTHGEFLKELLRYPLDNSPEDSFPLYLPAPSDSSALALTPGNFYLLPPHDGSKLNYHASFYMDNTRTFLLQPREVVPQDVWWKAGEIDPLFVQQIPTSYFNEIRRSQIGQASALSGVIVTTAGDFSNTFEPYHKRNLYRFKTFYHPYVCTFIRELNRNGIDGLFQRRIQIEPQNFLPQLSSGQASLPLDFQKEYAPTQIVPKPYPVEDVDFEYSEVYALYNWELFFHIPFMVADRLSKSQRFEEAQKWFHRIFNPTDTSSLPAPQRYWNTKPFYNTTQQDYQKQRIQTLLNLFAVGGDPVKRAQLSGEDLATLQEFENSVDEWRRNPFEPHLIARLRSTSYQKTVVMKYIDNLIAWGDQLFRGDTIESINEATQLYIMAAEILGRRPQEIPPRAGPITQSYNTLEPILDEFSNALIGIEEFISSSGGLGGATDSYSNLGDQPPQVALPTMLYFCVPKNDILLGYWDMAADRLFKIRHCMNIQGVVRQLSLFEPPIDPALLVRAAAAGIDISSVLNDINAGLPYYRFSILVQKTSELCSELKSLGAALLSALEKKDAEELALIRAEQETSLLDLVTLVKQQQCDEAVKNEAALQKSRDVSVEKYKYYQKLLGAQDTKVPAEGEAIPDQAYPQQATTQGGSVPVTPNEQDEQQNLMDSEDSQHTASEYEIAASIAHILPDYEGDSFFAKIIFGGSHIGAALQAVAGYYRLQASESSFAATMSAKTGQYIMRANEWALQSNLAAKEIMQIDKQIAAANTRIDMANQELSNHLQQIKNAQQIEDFMRSKYTNQELYSWMVGQVSAVYFKSYQLAYDVAKRAETAYRFELGLDNSNFIQFGYWDSLKRGLLAGERLYQDLKRMEVAYLDQNQREYEITKHVSLLQLDPLALAQLKQTGECFISIPEALFDLDFPGHYLRRIKYVSITVPCVTGPYVGVNCTLTLLKSSIRHDNGIISEKYLRQDVDPRFTDNAGAIQSIVTSSGQNDSGLFETNLRDERYLPFEGSGAISDWQIRLPRDFRQFDYDTISDIILHVRYTARDGGEPLRNHATSDLRDILNEFLRTDGQKGLALPVSLRHEFPSEWYRFLNPPQDSVGDATLTMNLGPERFPFMFQGRSITISDIELFVKITPEFASTYNESTLKLSLVQAGTNASGTTSTLEITPWNGLLRATVAGLHLGNWTLTGWHEPGSGVHERINPKAIEDVLVICLYSV